MEQPGNIVVGDPEIENPIQLAKNVELHYTMIEEVEDNRRAFCLRLGGLSIFTFAQQMSVLSAVFGKADAGICANFDLALLLSLIVGLGCIALCFLLGYIYYYNIQEILSRAPRGLMQDFELPERRDLWNPVTVTVVVSIIFQLIYISLIVKSILVFSCYPPAPLGPPPS